MRLRTFTYAFLLVSCLFGFAGCGGTAQKSGGEKAHEHGHDEHDHDEEGPHGGHIIELGAEEHHVELTHDDAAHKVGIYILGADVKTPTPIKLDKVTINTLVDGESISYDLPAVPQEGETDGNTSYFEIISEPLCTLVAGESEAKTKQARLSLEIDGKPYVGLIETSAHDHDHDHGHDH